MKFEELNAKLFDTLVDDKISPSENEIQLIKKIKQGKHLRVSASATSSLDLVLCWSTLSRAYQAFEGSPRVLWMTNSDQRVRDIVAQLRHWSRRSEIAIEPANDKGKIIEQRNFIFEGADAVVGNPKRILEIYNQSGIHVNQLNLIIIDEVDQICKNPTMLQHVRRICESTEKCMKLVVGYSDHPRIEPFMDEICFEYEEVVYEQ